MQWARHAVRNADLYIAPPHHRVSSAPRFWDSTELVRILAKFVHFGEVRNEFYALHSEISPN
jgi:hypothetical protein